ncbi:MAG: hypothetical protein HFI04_04865 [Lachnospiraceae bacterium]|jgi:hypothetical protein|nr:hypothetical protein [Lachnospiraceae bacterium]
MRQTALLGNADTKRTDYFRQAAKKAGLPICFADWNDWERQWESLTETELFLKIDPPLWKSCFLEELDSLTDDYKRKLDKLAKAADACKIEYFNHPSAIAELLDKRVCKKKLKQNGLPVTESLEAAEEEAPNRLSVETLLEMMERRGIHQVFIKPVNGSGAAGVSAFRWQPRTGRMMLYTCSLEQEGIGLVNTKRLRCFSKPGETVSLLNRLLSLDCIVERWYAKEEYEGYSYDLRAVVQENEVDFLLARLSKGPITNLHLNNHPMEAGMLGLPAPVLDSVEEICRKAMGCFTGLRSAGIDILLEKGSLKPRIIEMNAQGDLIYQDIYHQNIIYGHQAEIMKQWISGGGK